jgi:hypothetical protein
VAALYGLAKQKSKIKSDFIKNQLQEKNVLQINRDKFGNNNVFLVLITGFSQK